MNWSRWTEFIDEAEERFYYGRHLVLALFVATMVIYLYVR